MRFLSRSSLALGLGLALVGTTRADDDKKSASPSADQAVTVRGVISDFTLVGETDVDESTGKATTAEAMIITVIGHPTRNEADHKEHAAEVAKTESKEHAAHHHHRMNLYVVAMTPKTKVCEVMASGKEVPIDDKDADFDDLEVGDRVEVTFSPKMMEKKGADKEDGAEGKKPVMAKHGRHRTYFGAATQVKLMPEQTDGEHHDASAAKK